MVIKMTPANYIIVFSAAFVIPFPWARAAQFWTFPDTGF